MKEGNHAEEIYTPVSRNAKQIARCAGGRKPIRDSVHADQSGSIKGRYSHYHDGGREGGHVWYGNAMPSKKPKLLSEIETLLVIGKPNFKEKKEISENGKQIIKKFYTVFQNIYPHVKLGLWLYYLKGSRRIAPFRPIIVSRLNGLSNISPGRRISNILLSCLVYIKRVDWLFYNS